MAVLVCEVRQGSQLWPMLRVDRRADGHVHFTSGQAQAPHGLSVLQEAVQLCLTETTLQALQASASNPSPAQSPQTAAPPEIPNGSEQQDQTGAAEPLSHHQP